MAAAAIAASPPRTIRSARVNGCRPSWGSEVVVVVMSSTDVIEDVVTPRRRLVATLHCRGTQLLGVGQATTVAMVEFDQGVAGANLVTDADTCHDADGVVHGIADFRAAGAEDIAGDAQR